MTCSPPNYSPQNALDALARYLSRFVGTALPIEPSVQSEKSTADPVPHMARAALQRLEAIYSMNPLAAQVLFFAFVMRAGAPPEEVALVFAEPFQRVKWLTVPAASEIPKLRGRDLIETSLDLWDDTESRHIEHRSLATWIADIDRRVCECRAQVDEIKHARSLASQRKKAKVNHKKVASEKSDT